MPGLFITGTNTDVGKTYVAAMIARSLVAADRRVGVYKPVESGCQENNDGMLEAADARTLWEAAGMPGELSKVCPQRFQAGLSPPQAAALENKQVDRQLLRDGLSYWQQRSDLVLVEGAGGLMSPLSDEDYNLDLAADLGFPLVIVAANKLGAINSTLQTIITAQTKAPQLPIAGVILNECLAGLDDAAVGLNAQEIEKRSPVPLLASVGFGEGGFDREVDWFGLAGGK